MLAGSTKSQRQGRWRCPHWRNVEPAVVLAHRLLANNKSAAGWMAVLALLTCWLNKEGPDGDGAQRQVGGGAVGGACLLLAGTMPSRACWVNKELAARRMAVLAHRRDVQSASGLTAVLARRRDFESASGLTAVLACCCADLLIAVGTTAMRPVWPATPLRPLEPGG